MVLTPDMADKSINIVWPKFMEVLTRVDGLIFYRPVFYDYYYQALTEFLEDHVQYVEVRALLSPVSYS